jgi:hypothetical protein
VGALSADQAAVIMVTMSRHASFFRAIEASRKIFEQHQLPVGRTAIVLAKNTLEAWIFILALRAIGLNTIAVPTVAQAAYYKIKDLACIVVIQSELSDHNLDCAVFAGASIILVHCNTRRKNKRLAILSP